MSELKAYIAPTPDGTGLSEYYLKSEADRLISDLEESHKKEVEQLLMEIVKLKGAQYWRKCSEESPKDGQSVWAYGPNTRRVLNLHYHKSDSGEGFVCFPFIDDFYQGITHWMPFELPKTPEETDR